MALTRRTAEDFAHGFMAALPVGEIWPRHRDSTLYKRVRGLTGIVASWAARTAQFLLIEAFPPTSRALLTDWERVLGLPDPCLVPAVLTEDERRIAIREKLARRPGGQSRAYFIEIGRRLGYYEDEPSPYALEGTLEQQTGRLNQITITEFKPFMFGVSGFGEPEWRFAPPKMRFCWVVTVPGARLTWFRFGESHLGEDPHLEIRRAEDLECVLQKLKPAHTRLVFSYTGA